MIRTVVAFLAAIVTAFVAGALALSLADQSAWLNAAGAGAELPFGTRIGWALQNVYNLAVLNGTGLGMGLYPILVAIGLLLGFLAAKMVQRAAPSLRFWWYAGAGAVAMIVILLSLKLAMGMMVLPGARSAMGIVGQGVAGFLAGAVFAALSRRVERRRFGAR